MHARTYDVVVVGAGIVGLACAAECAEHGLRVAIVDQDLPAGGATAASMGHIVVMDDSEAQFALTRYSEQLWRELGSELPADVEYDPCGTLWVAADEEDMVEVRRKHAYYKERGVPSEILTGTVLEKLEPNLRPGMAGALLVREDIVVYAPCAARFLLHRAQARGADLRIAAKVLEMTRGRVLLSDGSELGAATLVNAAGTSAPELTPGIDVRKRKGHLVITDRYPGFIRHQLVELGYLKSAHSLTRDSVAFNVQPRKTGQVLVGSSRQFGAEDKDIDYGIVRRMMERAQLYMPRLAETSVIRVWTGFRAATPDKLPLIGPWPEDQSVYLATGHEGLGITTCLGTAKLLVAQLRGEPPAISIAPYLPSRVGRLEHARA